MPNELSTNFHSTTRVPALPSNIHGLAQRSLSKSDPPRERLNPADYVLHEAYDSGTVNFKTACQHVRRGQAPGTVSTVLALRRRGDDVQRQVAGFIIEGNLLSFKYGEELERIMSKGVTVDFLFERLKMCYFPSSRQQIMKSTIRERPQAMRNHFPDQVPENATEDWLTVKLWTEVRIAVIAAEQRCFSHLHSTSEIANTERVAFFLVPEISTRAIDDAMLVLMKEAGFTNIVSTSRVCRSGDSLPQKTGVCACAGS